MRVLIGKSKILAWAVTMCMVVTLLAPVECSAAPKVKLSKTSVTLNVGESTTLKVKNTTRKVKWSSGTTKVATVTQKGVVRAKKAGKAKIYAKVAGKKLTCKVTVKPAMALNSTKVTLTVGNSTALKVKNAIGTVKWSSNKAAVASVNKKGVVQAKSVGTATISATVSKKTLRCTVTVLPAPKLNQEKLSLKVGETAALCVYNTTETVEWISNDPDVAAVSADGLVSAVAEGNAEIVAEVGEDILTCEVVVSKKEETAPVATETPATEAPATETPVTEAPATETPVTEAPATEAPATETQATETPETETQATETQPSETPETETPETETQTTETQPSETPGTETQPSETPETETPVSKVTVSVKCREGGVFVTGASTQQIVFSADESAAGASVAIVNEKDETVFTQKYNTVKKNTDVTVNWDGKTDDGVYAAPGKYHVVIKVGGITEVSEIFNVYAAEEAGYMTLNVVDLAGNALPSAMVEISGGEGRYAATADEKGVCRGNYPAGEYRCTVTLDGYDKAGGVYTLNAAERNTVTIVMIPSDITITESGVQDGIIWKITTDGDLLLTGKYTGTTEEEALSFENSSWKKYSSRIYNAYVDVENLPSLDCMFWEFGVLEHVSFGTQLRQGTVKSLRSAFNKASSLSSVDFSNLNTENVTTMFRMFSECSYIKSLDLSNFKTGKVKDMGFAFASCKSLKTLDVTGFDVTNVQTMEAMFTMCNALTEIDLSSWGAGNVENLSAMFYSNDALKTVNLNNFVTSHATTMESMFGYCPLLTTVSWEGVDTGNVVSTKNMFEKCSSLKSIDLSSWNMSKVTDMEGMFAFCSGITSINLNGLDLSSVTTMEALFYGCQKLTDLNLGGVNTKNVQNMSKMFGNCYALTTVDLKDFDTDSATAMDYMFEHCTSLQELVLNRFHTENVTTMECMFLECSKLTSLNLVSFDTSKVTTMKGVFDKCYNLTDVNVSSFDTGNVTDMSGMFEQCKALKTVNVSSFDTSNVTTMEYMFYQCSSLETLDANNFSTPKITDCSAMFAEDKNLREVNIQGFDTASVPNMGNMFLDCSSMQKITVGSKWDLSSVITAGKGFLMFSGCGVSEATRVTE